MSIASSTLVTSIALGELELEALRIRARFIEHLQHLFDEVCLAQLLCAEVDRERELRHFGLTSPCGELRAGRAQHPLAYGQDQARFFGQRDEGGGRDHAALRVLPAQQHLGARDTPCAIDLQLVVQCELALRQGLAQVFFERHARAHGLGHVGVEKTQRIAPGVLGLV